MEKQYTRPIETPNSKLEGLRNFLQMIINNIEADNPREALLKAVDLQNDLYLHGPYSHPFDTRIIVNDDHSLDDIIQRYAIDDLCSYTHSEHSIKQIIWHIENVRCFDENIDLVYDLHSSIDGKEITHSNFMEHFKARCEHYEQFLKSANLLNHKHKLDAQESQLHAAKCAYADLIGIIECNPHSIDTHAIKATMHDLEKAFPKIEPYKFPEENEDDSE